MKMDFEVGDRIIMKKPHPCGSKEWEVLRVGIDFRIRCCGCDHQIMVPRKLVEKNTKSIKKGGMRVQEKFTERPFTKPH
ncbi:MAG: DUF951 domain-containing protein [Lachnospiraceae bacterium]